MSEGSHLMAGRQVADEVLRTNRAPSKKAADFLATAFKICDTRRAEAVRARMDVEKAIDDAFRSGVVAGEMELPSSSNPHEVNTVLHHWWSRGFAHFARIARAIDAEKKVSGADMYAHLLKREVDRLREDLRSIKSSYEPDQWAPLDYVKDGSGAADMAEDALRESDERLKKAGLLSA